MTPQAQGAQLPAIPRYMYLGKRHEYELMLSRDLTEAELSERVQAKDEVVKRLVELYDQGVPFFSKDVFRNVLDQLQHCRANPSLPSGVEAHTISIPAVNGTVVEFELETGSVKPRYGGTELVVQEPCLDYHAFHHLIRCNDILRFFPYLAYSSTRLIYPMKIRNTSTGEFLTPANAISVGDLQRAFDAGVKSWEDSEDCKRLRSLFAATPAPRVNKVVAFACSTMADDKETRLRVIHQHALILTLRDVFSRQRGEEEPEIKCFAQDPVYTETDEEVLRQAGITVLGDPRGFIEVDDETAVVSFNPNIPVRQIIADIARPAVMLWDHVNSEAEAAAFWKKLPDYEPGDSTDPESSRLREMVQNHYHEPVTLGPLETFGRASVYIRRG